METLDTTNGTEAQRHQGADPMPRRLFRATAFLVILPILVAAVRDGLQGWVPTWDAATTTFRVNDVLTRHPPLMGMWSSASHWSGHQVNFIGALQLYILAVPVKVLGNTWGVLLGMAAINTTVVLTTLWLIRRRVGYAAGLVGCAFMASLVWSLGSEVLVDITPMQMGVLPFMLLLVAAWSVADGDIAVLPLLAFIANYLLLDHLTFVLTAPLITGWGLLLLGLRLRSDRKREPSAWPEARRRTIKGFAIAAGLTLFLWIPPLFQQFGSNQPGNLSSLISASRAKPPFSATMLGAASALSATVAVPPMWLRDSFAHPRFLPDGDGRPFIVGLGCMLALLGFYAVASIMARRRSDRSVGAALATGLFALAVGFFTVKKSPGAYGLRGNYLHSLWSLAAFLWMVLALALVRTWPALRERLSGKVLPVFAALSVATFSLLTLPKADLGAGTAPWTQPIAKALDAQLVPALRGKGPILVRYSGESGAWAMHATALLSLQQAGIPIKLETIENARQYGFNRAFQADPPNANYVLLISTNPKGPAGYERIADAPTLSDAEEAEFERLDAQVRAWLDKIGQPHPSDTLKQRNEGFYGGVEYKLSTLVALGDKPSDLADQPEFRSMAAIWMDEAHKKMVVDTTGIDPDVLQRWGELCVEEDQHHVYGYLAPISVALQSAPSAGPPVNSGVPPA